MKAPSWNVSASVLTELTADQRNGTSVNTAAATSSR